MTRAASLASLASPEVLSVDSSNRIGINTESPSVAFDVKGDINATNVSVAGTITYEDVTNVDSVGVITGRNSLHILAGSVGFLTDNPTGQVEVTNLTGDARLSVQGGANGDGILSLAGRGTGVGKLSFWDQLTIGKTAGGPGDVATEYYRIDANGTLLRNRTTSRTGWFNDTNSPPIIQIEGDTFYNTAMSIFRDGTGASGPHFILAKGRQAIVQDNDILGSISFQAHDGTTELVEGASIRAAIDGTPSANTIPTRLEFLTNTGSSAVYSEPRMTIDEVGRVGINTAGFFDPTVALSIYNGQAGSEHTMLEIVADANETSRIVFSEKYDTNKGSIRYAHGTGGDQLSFHAGTLNTEQVSIGNSVTRFKNTGLVEKVTSDFAGTKLGTAGRVSLKNGNVARFTSNETGSTSINFIDVHSELAVGETVSFTVIIKPNGAGYITGVYIDSVSIPANDAQLNWEGGSAPSSGGANGYDVYTFQIIKTGGNTDDYLVFASQPTNFT